MSRRQHNSVQKSHILRALGKRIANQRRSLGLSQAELARQIGVSRFQTCKHESGSVEMPLSRFFEICKVLETSPVTLVQSVADSLRKS